MKGFNKKRYLMEQEYEYLVEERYGEVEEMYSLCPGVAIFFDKKENGYELRMEYDLRFEALAYSEMKEIEDSLLAFRGEEVQEHVGV